MNIFDHLKESFYLRSISSAIKIEKPLCAVINPNISTQKHFNVIFPQKDKLYNRNIITYFKEKYLEENVSGYFYSLEPKFKELADEEFHYFFAEPYPQNQCNKKSILTYKQCYSERKFSQILSDVFSLPKGEETAFFKKLVAVSKHIHVKLFIVKYNNKICGCFSLFQTRENYFILANAGLINSHRNLGLGYELFKIIRCASTLPIVLDSKESILINKILPKINYTFFGKVYLVSIDQYLNHTKI